VVLTTWATTVPERFTYKSTGVWMTDVANGNMWIKLIIDEQHKDDLVDCSPIVYHYATAHGQSLIFGWWATPQKLVNLKLPPLIVANETQLSSGVIVLWNQWRISIILVENLKRTIEITRSQTVPYGEHFPLCIAFRDFPWLWCFKHKELMQPGI